MKNSQRMRYLAAARRQVQSELDEMGYGRRAQPAAIEENRSTPVTGLLMAVAVMTVLFVGLSITGLAS